MDAAAEKAGCSEHAMRWLIQTDGIETESICGDKSMLTFRRIHPATLDSFANDLFSHARLDEAMGTWGVKFSDWVTKHTHGRLNRQLRWKDLISSIQAGKLKLYKSVEVPIELDQLFLCAEDLANFCDKRRSSNQCFL